MTPNVEGFVSDRGPLLECLNEECGFTLRIGYYENVDFVICPMCRSKVVHPENKVIRERRLKKERESQRESDLIRATRLEEEAKLLRRRVEQ